MVSPASLARIITHHSEFLGFIRAHVEDTCTAEDISRLHTSRPSNMVRRSAKRRAPLPGFTVFCAMRLRIMIDVRPPAKRHTSNSRLKLLLVTTESHSKRCARALAMWCATLKKNNGPQSSKWISVARRYRLRPFTGNYAE